MAQEEQMTMAVSSGNSFSSSNFNSETFWQHIIALDVQFNQWRSFGNYLKMLYIKRRNQLFRDLSRSELNSFRRRYIKLRYTILSKKYQTDCDQQQQRTPKAHIRNSSDSSFLSFIYDDLISSSDVNTANDTGLRVPGNLDPFEHDHHQLVPCVTPQSIAFCENFSFSGMLNHIFDQHTGAVSSIKFANGHPSLLAAASADGTLSICQLKPSPATILFILRGHRAAISAFEWSASNDLLVSASADATLRLWSTRSGRCLRVFADPANSALLTCALSPRNNNLLVTGNAAGTLNVLNLSTGIYSKNAVSATDQQQTQVSCMCFQRSETEEVLWVGDSKGYISAYRLASFETTANARLLPLKKVIVVAGCPISSLSTLTISSSSREVLLLANIACNAVVLFKCPSFLSGSNNTNNSSGTQNSGSIEFIKSFPVRHQNPSLVIRSSFCPKSSTTNLCIVTGSEDTCIYFYTFDGAGGDSDQKDQEEEGDISKSTKKVNKVRCVNKLQGHSAPVLDVCFNFEESLLASADSKGNIIIWKRESLVGT